VTWRIAHVERANASPDRDTTDAALVHVKRGSQTRQITVELAAAAVTSGQSLDARKAVREYLDDDEPPLHLIVSSDGVFPAQ
jgi:hypothetical protein